MQPPEQEQSLPLTDGDEQLEHLLAELTPRLGVSKAELVMEVEERLGELLGVDVRRAFEKIAQVQQHAAASLNLDRAHRSALVLLAHVLAEAARNRQPQQ